MLHLRGRASDVVVDLSTGTPTIAYWGAPIAPGVEIDSAISSRPVVRGAPDVVAPVSVVPEHAAGYPGRPGLLGCRPIGRDWSPRFTSESHVHDGGTLAVRAVDDVAGLLLDVSFELDWA
ncbi:MAG TPA: hypothetical protein VFD53_11965, partial [Ilumatobacter sp.]|nr:hypothetical protein [Ilumatobacter sp.]